jgi:hypothetical protein
MIGERIWHYRIIEKLGQGGMGELFLAYDTARHCKVALKFLPLSCTKMPPRTTILRRSCGAGSRPAGSEL